MTDSTKEKTIECRMAEGDPLAFKDVIDNYFNIFSEEVAVNKTIEQADTNPWAAVQVAEWCENDSYPNILSPEDKIPFLEKAINCNWGAFTERNLQDEFAGQSYWPDLSDAYVWSDPVGRAWEALGNYYLQFDDEHSLNHAYYCLTFAGMARFQVREQLKLYRQKMRLLNKFPNTAWELYPRDREEEEEKEKENKIIKKWENSEAYHSSYEGYARQKFQKINEYLEREFSSSIWAKATPETKVYLATGFYCFEQFSIINLGYLKIDFSAAINPVVRSLEEELALRFYSRYIKYLKAHYPTPEDYFEVNGIASYNKKTRYVIVHLNKYNAFSYNDAAKTDKFTLGSFGFVVGCGWSLGKDARIDKTMLEYCTKDLLSPTDFCKMKGISFLAANFEEEISGWLLELCAIVQKIKDIRNKASHGGSICSVVECEYCYNAILLVKKILIQLLEVSKLIN